LDNAAEAGGVFRALVLSIHWKPCFRPRINASVKRVDILPSMLHEFLRHTGAGGFVWSTTVSDYGAVSRNFFEMLFHFIGRNPDCSRQFRICFRPRLWIPRVYKRKSLAAIHTLFHFI